MKCRNRFCSPPRARRRPGPRKRGRGTAKQPVFGISERNGRVHTEPVSDCFAKSLLKIIRGRISPERVAHSDGWRGYDGLVEVGVDRHPRINKGNHFASEDVHINGIEAFWNFTKRRLAKVNGVKRNVALHLKECESRYGKSTTQLCQELWQMILKTKNR